MSGGKFNYKCFQISDFANSLQHEIDINNAEWDGTTDEEHEGQHLSKEVLAVVQQAQRTIEYAAKLAREIEWLYSGDHGEESFLKLVTDINVQAVMNAQEYIRKQELEKEEDND